MEDLPCPYLLNCLGNPVPTEKVLKNKKTVVFYFSASFCTPCEELLPKLRLLQEAIKEYRRCGIVIVYVPFDTDQEVMIKHFRKHHHGWYCIPLGEPAIKILELKYNVSYIPQIIVVKMDGTIVTREGKKDLDEHGNNVIIRWSEPDITGFRFCHFDWIQMSNSQRRESAEEAGRTKVYVQNFDDTNKSVDTSQDTTITSHTGDTLQPGETEDKRDSKSFSESKDLPSKAM